MSKTPPAADDLVVIGKIGAVHGVRGEVKVHSFTEPMENLLDYRVWQLRRDNEIKQVKLASGRIQGKALAAKIEGLDDREIARTFTGYEICILRSELPELADDELYWHQLEGLKVINQDQQLFGLLTIYLRLARMMFLLLSLVLAVLMIKSDCCRIRSIVCSRWI